VFDLSTVVHGTIGRNAGRTFAMLAEATMDSLSCTINAHSALAAYVVEDR